MISAMKKNQQIIITILLPSLFLVGMLLWFPFRYVFEFNTDEGVNLIKAMMTLKGFKLYSDVWSDQPPVLTSILGALFRLVGLKVNAGRLLILGMSAATIGAATDFLTRRWGIWHAIFGFIVMITLPFFTTLSVSIMIGLPSIAFAMLSFACLDRWHQFGGDIWLLASGIFLALSVFTKIWTVILGPIFLVGILIELWQRNKGKPKAFSRLCPLMWWGLGIVAVTLIVVIFMIGLENIPQLISVHLAAGETPEMQLIAETRSLNSFLEDALVVFGLGLMGCLYVILKREWHTLYLVAWVVVAYGFLMAVVVPAWFHHQLLVTIPAAMLGGIAIGSALEDLVRRVRESELLSFGTLPALLVMLLVVYFISDRVPPTADNFRLDLPNFGAPDLSKDVDFEIVALIGNYADRTHYLFTDRPMYAFRSGVAMPPELAVITQKRYSTGDPSQEEIYDVLMETKPEQIIIHRFEYPAVREYMKTRNFVRVDSSIRSRHFVMREIMDPK
jgi:hypothetical protein